MEEAPEKKGQIPLSYQIAKYLEKEVFSESVIEEEKQVDVEGSLLDSMYRDAPHGDPPPYLQCLVYIP